MRYCPECEAEYVANTVTCADCNVSLVDSLPRDKAEENILEQEFIAIEDFETIYEGDDPLQAQLVLKLLESNGFHCKSLGAHEARYPPTMPFLVQVDASRIDEARELIAAFSEQPTSDNDVE
jgi:hypothetical protein